MRRPSRPEPFETPRSAAPQEPPRDHRTLILLRHGRTAWNADKRIQGQLDPPLDEMGRAQADAVAPAIAKLGPVALWSSDLSRARLTAERVADAADLTPRLETRLRETMLGDRQGLTHEEYAALDPAEFARFAAGDWDGIPGAETAHQVADRMGEALAELTGGLAAGETAVAVSHGAAIRIAVARLLGWTAEQVAGLRGMANCGWAVLTERADGRWGLAAYNRTA